MGKYPIVLSKDLIFSHYPKILFHYEMVEEKVMKQQ